MERPACSGLPQAGLPRPKATVAGRREGVEVAGGDVDHRRRHVDRDRPPGADLGAVAELDEGKESLREVTVEYDEEALRQFED